MGVALNDQMHSYLTERKRMYKCYMKLFHGPLTILTLNTMTIYRNNTGRGSDQLSLRTQLVEGLFVKYDTAVEGKVPGQHSSGNTVPL